MSTELKPLESTVNEEVSVTSFFGGSNRGRCLQLTQQNAQTGRVEFVQLTEEQTVALAMQAVKWLAPTVHTS